MKEIKEFDTFSGTNGYIVVDGTDQNTAGGKLKFPNYVSASDGDVLTYDGNSDEIVWAAPEGGVPVPTDASFDYVIRDDSGSKTYEDDHIFYAAKKVNGQIKYGWMNAKELGGTYDTSHELA